MFDDLKQAVAALQTILAEADPANTSPEDAAEIVTVFLEIRQKAAAMRTLYAAQLVRSLVREGAECHSSARSG